jgi:hypothetical protein
MQYINILEIHDKIMTDAYISGFNYPLLLIGEPEGKRHLINT